MWADLATTEVLPLVSGAATEALQRHPGDNDFYVNAVPFASNGGNAGSLGLEERVSLDGQP